MNDFFASRGPRTSSLFIRRVYSNEINKEVLNAAFGNGFKSASSFVIPQITKTRQKFDMEFHNDRIQCESKKERNDQYR